MTAGTDWADHAAADGAAVSADPGESGDVAAPAPDKNSRPDEDATDVAPSNHLTGGGDPAEGER